MIPTVSNFPEELDTDDNLHTVHDGLRLRLAEDYAAGVTSITVESDGSSLLIMANFPSSGFITLTDQCSDIKERALSFHFGSRTASTFDDLTILPGFTDVSKPKKLTNVLQNVTAIHHNALKDAIIAVEEFVGVKGTVDSRPFGDTMEGRINFLHRVALQPKAWFSVNKRVGIAPFTPVFTDLSIINSKHCVETGDTPSVVAAISQEVFYFWDFGDATSTTSVTALVETSLDSIVVTDLNGGKISKTYVSPGIYDVTLRISDSIGENTVVFPDFINVRFEAPSEATINMVESSAQTLTSGILRTPANSLIDIEVPDGTVPASDPLRSYKGEELDGSGNPIDTITSYTWSLADDLDHENAAQTRASFSVGGIYDIILRTDTEFGSYRITEQSSVIDVIESKNLWLWTAASSSFPNKMQAYEMGTISETFKVGSGTTFDIERDSEFLDGTNNEVQAKREFDRNNGMAPRSLTGSGIKSSNTLIYWSTGRTAIQTAADERVNYSSYNGFNDTYSAKATIARPWNWADFTSTDTVYFLLGNITGSITANTSPTNQERDALNLSTLALTSSTFTSSSYENGGEELEENAATYSGGIPVDGYFGVHRTAWHTNNGYLIRNSNVGVFFKLLNFYRTEGNFTDNFQRMSKQPDMLGTVKTEGQLVPLTQGVYFFNNSGALSFFNVTDSSWKTGSSSANSASFRDLQDDTVEDFGDTSNTLLAASDGDRKAYLSYDYSASAVIRFNEVDTTFSLIGARPSGDQWLMGIY